MKKGLYVNFIITLLIGLLSFVVTSVFAKQMGTETLGLLKLLTQMVSYLSLVDLGIASASAFALYKPLQDNNIDKISIIVSTIDLFYKRISLLIILFGIVGTVFISILISTKQYGMNIYIYWMIFVVNTSISYIYSKYSVLFSANKEFCFVRCVQGASRIVVILLQIISLYLAKSFVLFLLLMMLDNIIIFYFYKKHYKNKYKLIYKTVEKDKSILSDMKRLFFHSICGAVVFNTDYIILSKYTSLDIVAIYASYLMVIQMILTIIGVGTPVITPYIGSYIARKGRKEIYILWSRLNLIYVFFATIIVITSYYVINPFIKLWMGDGFLLSNFIVILILFNLYLQITRIILEIFKSTSGYFGDIYNPILEAILNLVFSIILVNHIGLPGVIIGTILSNLIVVHFSKAIYVFKRCFNEPIYKYFIVYSRNFILFFISVFLINKSVFFLDINSQITTWVGWLFFVSKIFSLTIFISVIIFIFSMDFRIEIKKIINIISKYT